MRAVPAERVEKLVASFAACVAAFEASEAFPGPSLYFHLRAIERRRQHQNAGSLLEDIQFLEYAYAVLPAWGMHRMGPQAAKVADFTSIVTALRQQAPALQDLWPLHITTLRPDEARQAAHIAWQVIAAIKVSTSRTQIVAGSKMLHHLLPDLIPPIDRQYTFSFFTGQRMVPSDHAAFLDWFPHLASIGTRCQEPIRDTINRGGRHGHRRSQSDRQRHHGLHATTAPTWAVAPPLPEGHLPPPDHLLAA